MSVPYCQRRLLPGEILGKTCDGPDGCGHLLAVHVGVDHCPVCELLDIADRCQIDLLRSGEVSLNQYRAAHGFPTTKPTPEEDRRLPEVGDWLHVVTSAHGEFYCESATVHEVCADGSLRLASNPSARIFLVEIRHDETQQTPYSWHWPHDDRTTPGPRGEAFERVTINVHVAGSVLAERDLRRLIDQQLLRARYGDVDPSRFRH